MADFGAWLARWNMSLSLQEQIIHSGPWATVSSLCFFIGALVGGDLLVLRGALLMAYVFMLVNGLTGAPVWPFFNVDGRVNIDMVLWALMSGCLHGLAVARMLMDELPVRFLEFDDEQMARFFNRRSGMERLEARETLRRGKWLQVKAGHRIVSSVQLHEFVYLLVEGKCGYNSACCFPSRFQASNTPAPTHHHHTCLHHDHGHFSQAHSHEQLQDAPSTPGFLSRSRVLDESFSRPMSASTHRSANVQPSARSNASPAAVGGSDGGLVKPKPVRTRPPTTSSHHHHHHHAAPQTPEAAPLLRSGHIFSLSALNVFGVYIGFDQDHGRHLEVWAESDCLLYCWPMSAMEEMATSYSPALAAYWRNFIMYSLANEFEHRAHRGMSMPRCSTGEHEAPGWLDGARSRDFTDKLRPYEIPNNWSWPAMKRWLMKSLSPFPPHGIRHTALPTTGIMARTRAMAVDDARAQAAEAAQAELESLAACEICSHQLLSPRTAAAVRHRQETAWIETWRDTPAVQETSLFWAGLPSGCAVEVTEREFLQQQLLEQHQQHRHRAAADDDVTLWVADDPALDGSGAGDSSAAAAVEAEMWWQQQQADEEQRRQQQQAELDLLMYQQQQAQPAVQQPAVYRQQTSVGRRPVDSASSSAVLQRQQTADRFKPPAPLQLHLLQQQQQQDNAAGDTSSSGTAARFYAGGVRPLTPGPAAPAPSPALLQQQLQQQEAYQAATTSAWLAAHPIVHEEEEATTPEATTPVGVDPGSLAAPLLGQQRPVAQKQATRPASQQRQQQRKGGRGRK